MDNGDEMQQGDARSAIRILPPDGSAPIDVPPPPEPRQRRWLTPLLTVAALIGILAIATRPSSPEPDVPTTLPSPIAAIDTALIDLRPVAGREMVTDWTEVTIEGAEGIHTMARTGNSLIAGGFAADRAQLWVSGTGATWREAGRLELPEAAQSSVNHVVSFNGDLFAIGHVDNGVGLWVADYVSTWNYEGLIETMGSSRIQSVAAGSTLLALGWAEDRIAGWQSADGRRWESLGTLDDLADLHLINLIATDDWFFAVGGEQCSGTDCGAIYRSADGRSWEQVHDRNRPGFISDIAVTSSGFLAIGIEEVAGGTANTVWESEDGTVWQQIAIDDPAFASARVTISLESARGGTNPWAELRVDGDLWDVTAGTLIETAAGSIEITQVKDGSISWTDGTSITPLLVGESRSLNSRSMATTITAEGPRAVIAGAVELGGAPRPAVWVSDDQGASWERIDLPGGHGSAHAAITAGRNIVVLGGRVDGNAIWRGSWSTEAATAAAEQKLHDFVYALDQHDADALIELLPATDAGPAPPSFMIPSLGEVVHPWWDDETGALLSRRVVDTVDYLQATSTSLQLGECTSGATFSVADRVNLQCDVVVSSDLLSRFGDSGGLGSISALVRDGVLSSVRLNEDPSINLWRILSTHLAGANVSDTATPIPVDVDRLEFNAATAIQHAALADTVLSGLLSPGVTTTVETILGTMEWSWVTDIGVDSEYLGSLVWSDLGFFAAGYTTQLDGSGAFKLWNSADGTAWNEVPIPEHLESIWEMKPYRGGIVGQGYGANAVWLMHFDGTTWTEIPLTPANAEPLGGAWIAVSEDTVFAMRGYWEDEGFLITEASVIGPDLIPRPAALPPVDTWDNVGIELAGSESGFVLATTDYTTSSEMTVWHSADGTQWTLLADSQKLEDAQYLRQVQNHRSQYFVVGDAAEMVCSNLSDGRDCILLSNLWRSPDGTAWEKVLTDTGHAVSTYAIGSGPLGIVAFGQQTFDGTYPRAVYLSTDGINWTSRGGPTILDPDSNWWWIDTPVVSGDTVLAMGSSYNESDSREQPFMIIGRLVEE